MGAAVTGQAPVHNLLKYSYRAQISWDVFAIATLGALLLTLITVSFQTLRAAAMSPVKSLRAE